ncbi:hypothetical protein METBIDRAFT_35214 [Metschnikowia bicuspidata var. bicuspidata NRRL YB-4993]|uniref:HAD-like protein n=1 Tax=Metschnikowia bicuspidata var. bicuspidata NRRL YB-4993 TaxID=869754 RepID=A0A1A0HJH1_9ASCO|nr:hypothetical protein METBIDRAFT_35214 [Metschnikowia bicuspidata var. bicuspidata NRRL YB-4993]OBA24146.1 hypothetical protein METBIDRAFT_35214 [Metschnikowia bicuspidata var. bicuspidata NRRL YB-4993]
MFRNCWISLKIAARNYSLIVDPLQPGRISKSQAKSRFPFPRIMSFDIWNTLFTPRAPIAQQYYEISHGEFGIDKLLCSIETEFPAVFKRMELEFPNYGKGMPGFGSSNDWWRELITRLYAMPKGDKTTSALCTRLIEHFSGSEAYVLFDDVIPVLQNLQENGVRVVGASNSDYRVFSVMESLGISAYFPKNRVFLSYDLGVTKPSRQFFQKVSKPYYLEDLKEGKCKNLNDFLENAWHVGDHYEKDFVGAVKSGWNGVLLDRSKKSVFLSHKPQTKVISNDCFEGQAVDSLDGEDLVMISDNRVCVSGLGELLRLFGYDEQ